MLYAEPEMTPKLPQSDAKYAAPVHPTQLIDADSLNVLPNEAVAGAKLPLFGLDAEGLAARMKAAGEPAWRGKQLTEALYRQWIADLSEGAAPAAC